MDFNTGKSASQRLIDLFTWSSKTKLILAGILTALLLQPLTSSTGPIIAGDLAPRGNPDGILDTSDLLILQQIVLNGQTPTQEELLAGDVAPLGNPEGVLNAGDLVVLQRAILGMVTLPPVTGNQPPPRPDASLIIVGAPSAGQVQVTGNAGSVPGSSAVAIINYDTGDSVLVSANSDGSFVANIQGGDGQVLSVATHDTGGSPGPSVSLGIGNILTLSITAPTDGIIVNDDSILVSGTITGPPNTGVTVNGQIACVIGNTFYAQNIPLLTGNNTLLVIATTIDGLEATQSLTINSTGPSAIQMGVDDTCGFATHTASFDVINNSVYAIQQLDVDFESDSIIDFSTTDPTALVEHTYQTSGVYPVTMIATDTNSTQHVLNSTIVVSDILVTDGLLQGLYTQMLDRLRVGSTEGALNTISAMTNQKYRNIFSSLGANLATVADQLGTIESSSISEDMAEYVIVRQGSNGSQHYLIYLMRGEDGVWRIGSM